MEAGKKKLCFFTTTPFSKTNTYVILHKREGAPPVHTKGAISMKYTYTCKKVSLNNSI